MREHLVAAMTQSGKIRHCVIVLGLVVLFPVITESKQPMTMERALEQFELEDEVEDPANVWKAAQSNSGGSKLASQGGHVQSRAAESSHSKSEQTEALPDPSLHNVVSPQEFSDEDDDEWSDEFQGHHATSSEDQVKVGCLLARRKLIREYDR